MRIMKGKIYKIKFFFLNYEGHFQGSYLVLDGRAGWTLSKKTHSSFDNKVNSKVWMIFFRISLQILSNYKNIITLG